jgi:hypothetical protein
MTASPMSTVPTRAESEESSPVDCLARQRELVHATEELMRRLPLRACNTVDLLRLGSTCLGIAAQNAFSERDARQAVRMWKQCDAGEQQIRTGTYQALRNGFIKNRDYDGLFAIAADARRARQRELQRLRRQLRQLAVI